MNERRYYSEEAKSQAKREIALMILFAVSIGGGIGTALALLMAPKRGEELREDISDVMEDRVSSMERQIRELRKKLEDRISSLN